MLTAVIVLSIVSVLLLSALIFAVAKGIKYYAKSVRYEKEIGVYRVELAYSASEVRTDKEQRDLLVELTDSLQVLMSDITDEEQSNGAAIANFKKDIDRICSKTPALYRMEKDLAPSEDVVEQTRNRDKQGKNRNTYRKNPFTFINVCLILTILVNLISLVLKLIR